VFGCRFAARIGLGVGVFADAEFEFPAVGGFGALAPELEDAELGDVGLEADGDEVFVLGVVFWEMGFEGVGFGEFVFGPAA
jgi:hypothetical protein